MRSPEQFLRELPLVDTAPGSPARDFLAATGDADSDEMTRTIWTEFRNEVIPRLESLQAKNPGPKELGEELHALRGTSSQFGLFLLETLLFAWEKKEPDPVRAAAKYLPGAIAIAGLSLDAIENDFPHLKAHGG